MRCIGDRHESAARRQETQNRYLGSAPTIGTMIRVPFFPPVNLSAAPSSWLPVAVRISVANLWVLLFRPNFPVFKHSPQFSLGP